MGLMVHRIRKSSTHKKKSLQCCSNLIWRPAIRYMSKLRQINWRKNGLRENKVCKGCVNVITVPEGAALQDLHSPRCKTFVPIWPLSINWDVATKLSQSCKTMVKTSRNCYNTQWAWGITWGITSTNGVSLIFHRDPTWGKSREHNLNILGKLITSVFLSTASELVNQLHRVNT